MEGRRSWEERAAGKWCSSGRGLVCDCSVRAGDLEPDSGKARRFDSAEIGTNQRS